MAKGLPHQGAERFQLQHFYRALAWPGEPVKNAASEGFSPRCVKDVLEEKIFQRRRDLFTGLDLVFFDTTSFYFEEDAGEMIRGQVFCSFLALLLRKELNQALDRAGERFEGEDIKRDLKALQEMTITDQGKVITVRSRAEGCCAKVFQAPGVALPAAIRTP